MNSLNDLILRIAGWMVKNIPTFAQRGMLIAIAAMLWFVAITVMVYGGLWPFYIFTS